jgi:hypothetical protein
MSPSRAERREQPRRSADGDGRALAGAIWFVRG